MSEENETLVEVESKEDIEEVGNHGTTYRRDEGIFVATTVGTNDKEITFVYYN